MFCVGGKVLDEMSGKWREGKEDLSRGKRERRIREGKKNVGLNK